jgi:FkbM family methyltransferase
MKKEKQLEKMDNKKIIEVECSTTIQPEKKLEMLNNKIIIEVGGNAGDDTQRYASIPDTFVYSFEPVPVLAGRLKDKFKDATNVEIFELAVSDFNGVSELGISGPNEDWNMGCSSLNNFNPNIGNEWGGRKDFQFMDKTLAGVMRMDTFMHECHIDEVEFLHCDAQGSDLKVLQSFGEKLHLLKAGRVEAANTVSLYDGVDNSVYSIIKFLEENDFHIDAVINHFGEELKSLDELPKSTEEVDVYFTNKKYYNERKELTY